MCECVPCDADGGWSVDGVRTHDARVCLMAYVCAPNFAPRERDVYLETASGVCVCGCAGCAWVLELSYALRRRHARPTLDFLRHAAN